MERARSSFWLFYLGSNFGLNSKGDFLTKRAEVDNGFLTEGILGELSDKF